MHLHNPHLAADRHRDTKGDSRTVEDPRAATNIIFQTRGAPLSPFEDRMADALMACFEAGAATLDELAAALNARGVPDADGQPFTPASLGACLHRLGNALFAVEA
jgi:hypothetical protein